MPPLLTQDQSQFTVRPGIGGVDRQKLPDGRLKSRWSSIAEPQDPGLMERVVVREPLADAREVLNRRGSPCCFGQPPGHHLVGIEGHGLVVQHLPPEGQRPDQIALGRGQKGRRAEPVSVSAKPAAASSRSSAQTEFAMRRVCLGHEPEQVAVVGTKCQGLVEDGECLRSPLKLQKRPVERLGRLWRARREPSETAPQELESSLFLMQVASCVM